MQFWDKIFKRLNLIPRIKRIVRSGIVSASREGRSIPLNSSTWILECFIFRCFSYVGHGVRLISFGHPLIFHNRRLTDGFRFQRYRFRTFSSLSFAKCLLTRFHCDDCRKIVINENNVYWNIVLLHSVRFFLATCTWLNFLLDVRS